MLRGNCKREYEGVYIYTSALQIEQKIILKPKQTKTKANKPQGHKTKENKTKTNKTPKPNKQAESSTPRKSSGILDFLLIFLCFLRLGLLSGFLLPSLLLLRWLSQDSPL